jgi:DNA polymerase I-like protein with 3'-5' exonuclease and polymerase domains
MFSRNDYFDFENNPPRQFRGRSFFTKIPKQKGWSKSSMRVLYVIDHVHRVDLINRMLFSSKEALGLIRNLTQYAFSHDEIRNKLDIADVKFAAINFNYFKTYDLDSGSAQDANAHAVKRVNSFIEKYAPTHIIIFGDAASRYITSDAAISYKRGNIRDYGGAKLTSTITISKMIYVPNEKKSDFEFGEMKAHIVQVNLLGYVAGHLSNLLNSKNIYSLKHLHPKPIMVSTYSDFLSLYDKLGSDVVAVDVESDNLTVYHNKLLTMQFAFDTKAGFVLPMYHPNTPFTGRELSKIKRRLKDYFSSTESLIVGHNIGFDTRIIKQVFDIPYIPWRTWDTIFGQYALDENIGAPLRKLYKTPQFNLRQVFLSYDNEFYLQDEKTEDKFSKEDRNKINEIDIMTDVGFQRYAAMDVQSVIGIRQMQLKRASHQRYGEENYFEYYKNFVTVHGSDMTHVISSMQHRGTNMDIIHLFEQQGKSSIINKRIKQIETKFLGRKSVKRTNRILLARKNVVNGLFQTSSTSVFDLNKVESKQTLFFDVLKLNPLKIGISGKAKIDKEFQKKYAKVPEVATLTEIVKLKKIHTSFIKPFFKKYENDPDTRTDKRLRVGFGYQEIVTGRLNSFGPSLHQSPKKGDGAYAFKRSFVARPGYVKLKNDYSAHEIRCWGIISKDDNIKESFEAGRKLRLEYRKCEEPSEELKSELAAKGDVHKSNYSSFTGTDIYSVTEDMRQDSKGISFGTIYGMTIFSLSKRINKSYDETEEIARMFFEKFADGGNYLSWVVEHAHEYFHIISPLGRKRNLFGYIADNSALSTMLDNRSKNSGIQGFASDIGVIAARIGQKLVYQSQVYYGEVQTLASGLLDEGTDIMVHDSNEFESRYERVPLNLVLLEYSSTVGVQKYLKHHYDYDLSIPFEIDFEIGFAQSTLKKWDFRKESLRNIIEASMNDALEAGQEFDKKKELRKFDGSYKKYSEWLTRYGVK